MNDRVNTLLTDEVLAKVTDAAYDVIHEHFGMPYMARCQDYPNIEDLKRADAEADAKNDEAIKLVVNTVIDALRETGTPSVATQDQERQLRSIEYHLEVARDVNQPAIVMHHAKNDLLQRDVPFLLDLVRSLVEELNNLTNDSETD